MSITFTKLQELQEKRAALQPDGSHDEKSRWIVGALLAAIIILVIAINLYLFLVIKGYSTDKIALSAKVSGIEDTLNTTVKRVSAISSDISKEIGEIGVDLDTFRANLQETNNKIAQVNRNQETHKAILEKLAKANDIISDNLKSLEKEVKNLAVVPPTPTTKK